MRGSVERSDVLASSYIKPPIIWETLKLEEEGQVSKGPGHVARKLIEIFKRTKRSAILSTYDLCCAVFGTNDIEKKHRVSVLRAMKRISQSGDVHIWRIALRGQPDDVWFNCDEQPPLAAKYRSIVGPASDGRPRKLAKEKR